MSAQPVAVMLDDEEARQEAIYAALSPKQKAFLTAFVKDCYTALAAANKIGISRRLVYYWTETSPDFKAAYEDAQEAVADKIEARLIDRALKGNQAWDVTAGIFTLKGLRPKFRDNYTVKMESLNINASLNLNELEPAERLALLGMALAAEQRQIAAPVVDQGDEDDEEGG